MPGLNLPQSILSLLQRLLDDQFDLLLIGGGARALMLGQELPKDLDFEIRFFASTTSLGGQWLSFLEAHLKAISSDFSSPVETLKFGVFRFLVDGYSLELASPRIEIFKPDEWGHSNFTVQLHQNLDDSLAFSRRDFTFNAFAWDLRRQQFVDPFSGQDDWRQRIMRPCGQDFFRDPVRFLRAIRFSLQFNLSSSLELEQQLCQCQLQALSPFHFLNEASKVHFGSFVKCFTLWTDRYQLMAPSYISLLQIFEPFSSLQMGLFILASRGKIDSASYMQIVSQFMLGNKKWQKIWIKAQEINQSDAPADDELLLKIWMDIWK